MRTRSPISALTVALAPLLLALACTEGMPHATSADASRVAARFPQSSANSLEEGRLLYLTHCGSCHALREPSSLAADAWPARVDDMQKSQGVHLSNEDARSITAYLVAVSSR
ncbi:MAG TPA: cytochrome c [Polyangiaceae bacterium]